jgi:hypothetical protein
MNRNQLSSLIALAQVALAIALWWYSPYQFIHTKQKAEAQFPGQNIQLSQEFFRNNLPAPAERLSLALNFPAAVLAGPFNVFFPKPLYESKLRILSVKDLAFFAWTGFFWYWLASTLLHKKSELQVKRPSRLVATTMAAFGLVFALAVGVVACNALISKWSAVPSKQVAPFGLFWSVGLALYFARKLRYHIRHVITQS